MDPLPPGSGGGGQKKQGKKDKEHDPFDEGGDGDGSDGGWGLGGMFRRSKRRSDAAAAAAAATGSAANGDVEEGPSGEISPASRDMQENSQLVAHPDLGDILDRELGADDGGIGADGVNPLERMDDVLLRFRAVYDEANEETAGPLRVAEDPNLARARAKQSGQKAPHAIDGRKKGGWRRRLTRKGRREKQQRRAAEDIHRAHPELTTLMIVRIQRTWRGYSTRKTIDQIKRQGGNFADLHVKRVLRTSFLYGRTPHIADVPYRRLPMSFVSAVANDEWDGSPYRVSAAKAARWFGAHDDGYLGLAVLCLAVLGTIVLTYLIPGWAAVLLRTIFYDGENSLDVGKIVGWIVLYTFITGLAVGLMYLAMVYRETLFHNNVDFVLALLGLKKGRLITMEQLQELRGPDLHVASKAIYRDFVFMVIHFVHWWMGVFTLFGWMPMIGFAVVLGSVIFVILTVMYDAHIANQMHIENAVAQREGLVFRAARRCHDSECTQRNYQLGLSKTVLRMSETFSRFHAVAVGTAIMLVVNYPLILLYAGASEVWKNNASLHTLTVSLLYMAFTFFSLFKFNECYCEYTLAKRQMRRLFTVAYHFKRFTEERTFKENECKVIAKVEGMKEVRQQPRSYDLFMVFAAGAFCMGLFIVGLGFGSTGSTFDCGSVDMDCYYQVGTGDMAPEFGGNITVGFEFSVFNGCEMGLRAAKLLQLCAVRGAMRHFQWRPWTHERSVPLTASFRYSGWRGDERGFSKLFGVNLSVTGAAELTMSVCPAYDKEDPDTIPFVSRRGLLPGHPLLDVGDKEGYLPLYENDTLPFQQDYFATCGRDATPAPALPGPR